jgi:squalene monooxygenase
VSLLSGLNPDPSALVTYFFMIAVFAMGRLPLRKGLRGVWLAVMVLIVACKIILPIIYKEGIRRATSCCALHEHTTSGLVVVRLV